MGARLLPAALDIGAGRLSTFAHHVNAGLRRRPAGEAQRTRQATSRRTLKRASFSVGPRPNGSRTTSSGE